MSYHDQRRNNPSQGDQPGFKKQLEPEWIQDSLTRDAINYSQKLGTQLKIDGLTTTQIRNFFGEVKRIQSKGFKARKGDFLLLLPKLHYAAKRANKPGTYLFKDVFDKAHRSVQVDANNAQAQFDRFVQLLESTLAFHRAAGGK